MPAKLVAIGDSLTQGFQSGSISRTAWSYPAMIARALGVAGSDFKVPDFSGAGGLPVNLEDMFRLLAKRYGSTLRWYQVPLALFTLHSFMDGIEDYWERGDGTKASPTGPLHDDVAVWGFTLGDADIVTPELCASAMPAPSHNILTWNKIPEFAMYRTAIRVLNPSLGPELAQASEVDAAKAIAQQQGGIENLIVWLGANNCLGTVTSLKVVESTAEGLSLPPHEQPANLWRPADFAALVDRVYGKIAAIPADRVFVATVPHVTIAPVCRGISPHIEDGNPVDGYFEYYTHFWIWDDDFKKSPESYPYLTGEQARYIDDVIDAYNAAIRAFAAAHQWIVVDLCDLLDRLAYRRQLGAVSFPFPRGLYDALAANPATAAYARPDGSVDLDTRYMMGDGRGGLSKGGLFSLDGMHPTTVAYGLIAHEFLKVMEGDAFADANLDWPAIVAADTLVTNPPSNLDNLQDILALISRIGPIENLVKTIGGQFP